MNKNKPKTNNILELAHENANKLANVFESLGLQVKVFEDHLLNGCAVTVVELPQISDEYEYEFNFSHATGQILTNKDFAKWTIGHNRIKQ